MIGIKRIKQRIGGWRQDERGSVAVETILMVPLLSWAMLATLTYFHAYRSEAISEKASLTIADMFSREADYITPDYIAGARGQLQFLTLVDNAPDLRVSVIQYDDETGGGGDYLLVWSEALGDLTALDNSALGGLSNLLPVMSHNEQLIVVETQTSYVAPYSVGLDDFDMKTFTVISPRFVTRLCWNDTPEQGVDTEVCGPVS